MIERTFMASETNDDKGRKFGPFSTASEAEIQAQTLGWNWVVVYAHNVDDNSKILDVTKRYYQPAGWSPAVLEQCKDRMHRRTPEQVEQLRRELSTPDPKPLSLSEAAFFEEYERQMETPDGKNS